VLVIDVAADCNPDFMNPGAAVPSLSDAARDVLAVALDWSMSLVGSLPVAVRAIGSGSTADRLNLHVEFRRPSAGGIAPAAQIRLTAKTPATSSTLSAGGSDTSSTLRASVECLHGTALLEGPQDVTWYLANEDSPGERFVESLASDRPAVEVMLDHFCRRVVGGLIPVPTLDDLCRAFQLIDSALRVV
jgi:hypothetical protein